MRLPSSKYLQADHRAGVVHETHVGRGFLVGDVAAVGVLGGRLRAAPAQRPGYLANWKVFEPRKLNPVSMEPCNAPVAVITLMTENTPMVMPSMVRPERNLFAPSADMARAEDFNERHDDKSRVIHNASACTGSSREADHAGCEPGRYARHHGRRPRPMSTRLIENSMGNDGNAAPTP